MQLDDKEKAELKSLIDRGEPLPAKYRHLLFAEPHEAELIWPGKTHEVTNVVLPFSRSSRSTNRAAKRQVR